MGFAKIVPLLLLAAKAALANTPIAVSDFTTNGGLAAAMAAAPMWYMASGTCMPSAAEDGEGNQTNGVDADNCNINALANGCPQQPPWQGANTFYGNVSGEPFTTSELKPNTLPIFLVNAYLHKDQFRRTGRQSSATETPLAQILHTASSTTCTSRRTPATRATGKASS